MIFSARTRDIQKVKTRKKLGTNQLSRLFCFSPYPCLRSIFCHSLSCHVLEVCQLEPVSPSSHPPLVGGVSHWPPVNFRQGKTADLWMGGERDWGYLFPPELQFCFILPWFWSGCVPSSSTFYQASHPLLQGCSSCFRSRVLKLPHYCLSLSASPYLDFDLLGYLLEFMDLIPNSELDIKQVLKTILNGSDSTQENALENT